MGPRYKINRRAAWDSDFALGQQKMMTREEQLEQLDLEFSMEAWLAAQDRREPDYTLLADRLNKYLALVDGQSNDIVF